MPPMDPDDPATWPPAARALLAGRTAAPEETPLLPCLRERVRADGPLTWAQYMVAALYHPEHGYYLAAAPPLGPRGDFVTAPEHHPAFGRLVGRRVRQAAAELGDPAGYTVVEMGAGSGALAAGILAEWTAPSPLRYRIVEPYPVWRARQEARLAPWRGQVEWANSLDACIPFTGLFLANELLDAFPVHRVVRRGAALRELYVTLAGDRLVEVGGEPSSPALAAYFAALGLEPAADAPVEVCLGLRPWVAAVSRRLARGSLLVLDYGATAEELYGSPRPGGTLRAYRGHASVNPLAAPGRQDLTADVDFTTLLRAGEAEGLALRAFTTQRAFLLAMGWERWLRAAEPGGRRALTDLIDLRLMGGMRVLELRRA